jgi:hypothetical protein
VTADTGDPCEKIEQWLAYALLEPGGQRFRGKRLAWRDRRGTESSGLRDLGAHRGLGGNSGGLTSNRRRLIQADDEAWREETVASTITAPHPSSRRAIRACGAVSRETMRHRGSGRSIPPQDAAPKPGMPRAETAASRRSSRCSIRAYGIASRFPVTFLERRRAVTTSNASSKLPARRLVSRCGIGSLAVASAPRVGPSGSGLRLWLAFQASWKMKTV